jgi:anti-sigma factor RsiW
MNSQLSSRDWEYLSAYLDRQLKPKEIASLEARLSADPGLSAALGELQRTRDALRSLPKMRAPRNFTLTPQMVGQRSPLRAPAARTWAPAFGFASALATFLLVLVIAGDVLGILAPSTKPVAQAPALTAEVAMQPATTAAARGEPNAKQAAPMTAEVLQPTTAAAEVAPMLQAPQALQAITGTAALSLTAEAGESAQPFAGAEVTPAMQEIMTITETKIVAEAIPETISAEQASGMGPGMVDEMVEDRPPSSAILTSQGLMWNTTISLTVSPTETLTFPMTVTIEGAGISVTYDAGVGGGLPEEELTQAETASTATPAEPPLPREPEVSTEAVPAPTGTPEIVALALETPTPSQPELQTMKQVVAPTQTLTPSLPASHPTRPGQLALRIVEIALALLALVTTLAALFTWLVKRI